MGGKKFVQVNPNFKDADAVILGRSTFELLDLESTFTFHLQTFTFHLDCFTFHLINLVKSCSSLHNKLKL